MNIPYTLGQINLDPLPQASANANSLERILTIVFSIAGATALLFVVIGGFKFVLSRGDPQGVAKARNSVVYALIGLAVSVTAIALVTLVLGRL
jgi:hypothetical protein